jgi:hypothetical protein
MDGTCRGPEEALVVQGSTLGSYLSKCSHGATVFINGLRFLLEYPRTPNAFGQYP